MTLDAACSVSWLKLTPSVCPPVSLVACALGLGLHNNDQRLGGYFSQCRRLRGCPRPRCWQMWCLAGAHCLALGHLLSVHSHGLSSVHGHGESETSASSSHRDTNPITWVPPPWANYRLKTPPSHTITLELVRNSNYEFWEDTDIQPITCIK